jgi:hypothetical protein
MALLVVAGRKRPLWTGLEATPPVRLRCHPMGDLAQGRRLSRRRVLILFDWPHWHRRAIPHGSSRDFSAHWRIRRFVWTWIGGAIAFLMVAISWASRLEAIFHAMGLVFAPAVGAMAGDYLRQRGGWAGLRRGINPPGLFAWAAGLGVHAARTCPLEVPDRQRVTRRRRAGAEHRLVDDGWG